MAVEFDPLYDENGAVLASVGPIRWSWFKALPSSGQAAIEDGSGLTTEADGSLIVPVQDTGRGYLLLETGTSRGVYSVISN